MNDNNVINPAPEQENGAKVENEVAEQKAPVKPVQPQNTAVVKKTAPADEAKGSEFKFFKCCSATLKRFSVLIFVINLFLSIAILGVAVVLLGVYVGFQLVSLLLLPLITVFVIMILMARFISAMIYGFAEIVEKSEK